MAKISRVIRCISAVSSSLIGAGSFLAWLCGQSPVHAMEMPGSRYDIGNLESYENVKKEYKGITKC